MRLIPKNWQQFQHYKDRCPPWIKLHRDLLNDRAFMLLPIASKALAPLLWLLASESKSEQGDFDASVEELEFRLRLTPKEIETGLRALIDKGFFIVASGVLADRQQPAIPETETETERETEPPRKRVAPPDGVDGDVWKSFLAVRRAKKAPLSELAMAGITREAEKAGWTLEAALSEIVTRGWTAFKAEWVTAKPTFAQQAADVRTTTVPAKPGRDPNLVRIEQDAAKATPMTAEIRQALAQAVGRMTQ